MKICFLADSDSIHTKRWCAHFAAAGHDVCLISFKPTPVEKVKFYFINSGDVNVKGGNWKLLFQGHKVKKILKKVQPDILHSLYATSYGFTGARTNFHPFVVTALGTDVLLSPKNSFVYRLMIRYVFRKADAITLMAEHMKEVIKELKLGDCNKCEVVPFGIDTKIFNGIGRNTDNSKFIITSTRNFEDVYNIPHLIRAVADARMEIGPLQLNLIGDGSRRKEIETLVKEMGLNDCTKFYGRISQPEIAEVLKSSHAFVTVSLSDGNNISLNEAMACGAVCVASDIPANTQWIENRKNGFLVGINDVNTLSGILIKIFREYSSMHEEMHVINKKIIKEKADWNENMKKVELLYEKLCERKA